MTLYRRLRDLLAHARAGHRIGCVSCAEDAWDRAELSAAIRRYSTIPSSEFVTLDEATAGWNAARSPVDAARRRGEM